jgi:hypothetical protein
MNKREKKKKDRPLREQYLTFWRANLSSDHVADCDQVAQGIAQKIKHEGEPHGLITFASQRRIENEGAHKKEKRPRQDQKGGQHHRADREYLNAGSSNSLLLGIHVRFIRWLQLPIGVAATRVSQGGSGVNETVL